MCSPPRGAGPDKLNTSISGISAHKARPNGRHEGVSHGQEDKVCALWDAQGEGALVALRADKMLVELAKQYELHPNQITEWKPLHAKIGQQALEIDFLAGALDQAGWWSAKG